MSAFDWIVSGILLAFMVGYLLGFRANNGLLAAESDMREGEQDAC